MQAKLCGVEHRAPPIFGRATIIDPHSSLSLNIARSSSHGLRDPATAGDVQYRGPVLRIQYTDACWNQRSDCGRDQSSCFAGTASDDVVTSAVPCIQLNVFRRHDAAECSTDLSLGPSNLSGASVTSARVAMRALPEAVVDERTCAN